MEARLVAPEEFRNEAVKPGTKQRFLVRVGELSTGSKLDIPVIVVRGARQGPCVFVAGGQSADEVAGVEAVKRFASQIKVEEVTGSVVLAPLMNPPAWAFRSPLYPLDAPTVGNIFRLGHGDTGGMMTERVLYALADCIAVNANFAILVYATHQDSVNYPFTFVFPTEGESPEVHKKREEMARLVGNEIVYKWPPEPGGLTSILQKRGCPTVATQAGEGWRILEPFPSILLRGIYNFCKAAGVLKGEIEMPSMQVEIARRVEIRVNVGGMSRLFVTPGQYVRAGQVVAEVRDMFDNVVEEISTPESGIVVRCTLLPAVATGGRICNVFQTDLADDWERRVVPELERRIAPLRTAYSRA